MVLHCVVINFLPQDIKCKALRRPKSCSGSVQDIEDLLKPCTQCKPSHEHQCPYYKNFEDRKRRNDLDVFTQCGPLDQVKLKEKCKQYEVCPFYVSRHLVKNADMTFLPYSYVFNPHILRFMQLPLEVSVTISSTLCCLVHTIFTIAYSLVHHRIASL